MVALFWVLPLRNNQTKMPVGIFKIVSNGGYVNSKNNIFFGNYSLGDLIHQKASTYCLMQYFGFGFDGLSVARNAGLPNTRFGDVCGSNTVVKHQSHALASALCWFPKIHQNRLAFCEVKSILRIFCLVKFPAQSNCTSFVQFNAMQRYQFIAYFLPFTVRKST